MFSIEFHENTVSLIPKNISTQPIHSTSTSIKHQYKKIRQQVLLCTQLSIENCTVMSSILLLAPSVYIPNNIQESQDIYTFALKESSY